MTLQKRKTKTDSVHHIRCVNVRRFYGNMTRLLQFFKLHTSQTSRYYFSLDEAIYMSVLSG